MVRRGLVAVAAALMVATVVLAAINLIAAQSASAALTGVVTSQEEGAMEGVVVSARRAGSTITVSVVSGADGRFSFPRNRLEPGAHSIRIRAIGTSSMVPEP